MQKHNEDVFNILKSSLWNDRYYWYKMLTSFYGRKFIRDFACPQRFISRSTPQLHKQLIYFGSERKNDCYMSVYAFNGETARRTSGRDCPDYEKPIIDRIAFDLDAHDSGVTIKETYKDAMKFEKLFGRSVVFIYTGNQGFHCYIMLKESISREQLMVYHRGIRNKLGLFTACPSTGLDTARVLRIPYTLHTKTSCQVLHLPKLSDYTTEKIIKSSSNVKNRYFMIPMSIDYEVMEVEKLCSVLEVEQIKK